MQPALGRLDSSAAAGRDRSFASEVASFVVEGRVGSFGAASSEATSFEVAFVDETSEAASSVATSSVVESFMAASSGATPSEATSFEAAFEAASFVAELSVTIESGPFEPSVTTIKYSVQFHS